MVRSMRYDMSSAARPDISAIRLMGCAQHAALTNLPDTHCLCCWVSLVLCSLTSAMSSVSVAFDASKQSGS